MAGLAVQRSPSAGSVIKKIIEINPELGVLDLSALIRKATFKRGGITSEYADVEVIDEELALSLARATLTRDPEGKSL